MSYSTTPKVLVNYDRYLSEELVEQCFEFGSRHTIDKRACGNGFTHQYLLLPTRISETDILICPNRSVVLDKEQDFKQGKFKGLKIGFLCKGCYIDYSVKYDKIVCVADSFNQYNQKIKERYKIRYILVDEQHTVEQSAGFRKRTMLNLKTNLTKFRDSAISSVTATPNLSSTPTIVIENELMPNTDIFISKNAFNSIGRIVSKINKKEHVFVFTQSATIIKEISSRAFKYNINFVGGSTLKASLLSKGDYVFDKDSNLTIVTSSGYEGWSSYKKNASNFFFVSYDNAINSMLGSNIYQANNRLRLGAKYSEIVFFESRKTVKYKPKVKEIVDSYINLKTPNTKKQGKNYEFEHNRTTYTRKEIYDFVYFKEVEDELKIFPIEDSMNVHLEKYSAKCSFENTYKQFFKDRKVRLFEIDQAPDLKVKGTRLKDYQKIAHLLFTLPSNMDLIDKALYPSVTIQDKSELESALSIAIAVKEGLKSKGLDVDNSTEKKALDFIRTDNYAEVILEMSIKDSVGSGRKTRKKAIEDFIERNTLETSYKIIYELVSGHLNYNVVGSREFGNFTSVSNSLIHHLSSNIGLLFTELDIVTAFPKILYAMFGIDMPKDIYGTDEKKRGKVKKQINTHLNWLATPTLASFNKKRFEEKKKGGLNEYNKFIYNKSANNKRTLLKSFPKEIVDWLIDTFGKENNYSGAFNEFITRHEKNIIKLCMQSIKGNNQHLVINDYENKMNFKMVRKHDAVLIFHKEFMNFTSPSKIVYLKQENWFNITRYYDNDVFFLKEFLVA